MKNNKGFTLIELLAVIVVLAIVTVLGATTVLPYMSKAREKSFRIEATEVVNSGKRAMELKDLGKVAIKGNTASCKKQNSNEYCFTVSELIDLGIYDGDKSAFSGKLEIDATDSINQVYTLYFKKNDEFKIIGGTREDYNDSGVISSVDWLEEYNSCSCS